MVSKRVPLLRVLDSARGLPVPLRPGDTRVSASIFVERLLFFLSKSSLLSLRLVDQTTKAMVDSHRPRVVSSSRLTFPLNQPSPAHLSRLDCTAPYDQSLTVDFSKSSDTIPPPSNIPLPPYPSLQYLHLNCPSEDDFYPLLRFRLALQSAAVPLLTHLTLSNVSLPSILALRWGSFTSFGDSDWHGTEVWRNLKHLDLKLLPPRQESSPRINESDDEADQRRKDEQQEWRTGIKILHDWLNSFASTGTSTERGLETLKFEWLDYEGPNPLLLDLPIDRTTRYACTTAPPIMWRKLEQIWLKGVYIGEENVRDIKERARQLKLLMVEKNLLTDEATIGWEVEKGGYKWWEVYLGERYLPLRGQDTMLSAVAQGTKDPREESQDMKDAGNFGAPSSEVALATGSNVAILL